MPFAPYVYECYSEVPQREVHGGHKRDKKKAKAARAARKSHKR
jgi:hypothetical protein